MKPDFESYLIEQYAEIVNCTEDDTPNEELWMDKCNEWMCSLEADDFIKFANKYVIELAIDNKLKSIWDSAIVNNKKES